MNENRLDVYRELCSSYRAIDDFRAKLLAFLPFATGGGIFLLLNKDLVSGEFTRFFAPIGAFGFLITLGLFAYEIYGIKKCHALINGGKQLEHALLSGGQFSHRPREVAGFINEPLAAGIIYPAVLGAWTYLALYSVLPDYCGLAALLVFLAGFAASLLYSLHLKSDKEVTALKLLNENILQAEEIGLKEKLEPLLHQDFTIVRASGEKQNRQQFLEAVPANKNRGRSADQVEVRLYDDRAIFACRVTTNTRDKDGNQAINYYWNTRLFVRENGEWRCAAWQVMKIAEGAIPQSRLDS
ncbi:MAG: hypothetical protein DKINENOH_03049 [bacterium]|nr:hypothetical protein [bacterium]